MANTIDTMTSEAILRGIIDGSLTEFEDDTITSLGGLRKFSNVDELTRVTLPNLTALTVNNNDLYFVGNCKKLQLLQLPKLRTINAGQRHFAGNGSASSMCIIVFPSIEIDRQRERIFLWCYADKVDLGEGYTYCSSDVFYGGKYNTVIFRRPDAIVAAWSQDTISDLTTAKGNTIYIRKALYDHLGDGSALDYKAATNWSSKERTYACIEGSEYENFYADGTPITQMGGVITSSILAILLGAQLIRREVAING